MFEVTFRNEATGESRIVRVDRRNARPRRIGLAGSISDIATEAGIEIEHSCGGVCACSTCHVKVVRGGASCSEPTGDEEDMLETARGRDADSRLACQCVPDGSQELEVLIPSWGGGPGGSTPLPPTRPRPPSGEALAAEPGADDRAGGC